MNSDPMYTKYFALFTDCYSQQAPITVFRNRNDAVRLLAYEDPELAAIRPIFLKISIGKAAATSIPLLLSLEDSGMYVHAACWNMVEMRAAMSDHVGESRCTLCMASVWSADIEKGSLRPFLSERPGAYAA